MHRSIPARAAALVLVAASLIGIGIAVAKSGNPFKVTDKAHYADAKTVDFVRPGLVFKVGAVQIAPDGTITADVKVTDPRGLALDRLGVETPGPVNISMVAAVLPKGTNKYVSYTTRVRTVAGAPRTAIQAAADAGGTWTQIALGEYRYRFNTRAPSSIDRTATHAIGVYGNRNLSEFDLGTNYASSVHLYVPAGGAVTQTHELIKNATCNSCHEDLAFHGGSRRGLDMCVLCHTPQTTDPLTGNTLDMAVMTHKIHTGRSLPSVRAGGKYQLNGFGGLVDFSHVGFPGAGGTANCTTCHALDPDPAKRPAQATTFLTNPTRENCGSCHDTVNFSTGAGHRDIAQANDDSCATCHKPQGDSEFDASIAGAHVVPTFSASLEGVVTAITGVANATAGNRPVVSFTLKDRKGNPIELASMDRVSVYLSGPTADFATQTSFDGKTAETTAPGAYRLTLSSAIPATARGTYRISIAARKRLQLPTSGDATRQADDIAANVQTVFAVDGSRPAARRQIVDTAKCNACHVRLNEHGVQNTVEQCAMCHNPTLVDPQSNQSANFSTMIHRIHAGRSLGAPYTLRGNTWIDVIYPGNLANCNGCHVNNSQQLPLAAGISDVAEPAGPLTPRKPEANACTSCHGSVAAASHALLNTTVLGESCSVCHGRNSTYSVDRVHAR
jgi:OmcA/MtrC family decaheme c-type cytochrome